MQSTISDPNEALQRFLDRYCATSVSPGYAVMLRGPWGSGKTWFIENYQEKLRLNGTKSLYVSLFGVRKTSDITDQFFAQIHPMLGNPKVQKAWTVAKSLLKGTMKVDWDGDGNDDGSLQITVPDLEKWASTEGAILIFDDLERCAIQVEDVLGFINQFIEHNGYRVLILANEEAESIGRNLAFATIKEKVIGRTFQIQPNAEAALSHFLKEIQARKAHPILTGNREEILGVFHRAKYDNLRQLRQAIFDFADLWDCVQNEGLDEKTEFMHCLLNDVLALSIEYRAGTLTINDMSKLGTHDWSTYLNDPNKSSDEASPSTKELILQRHGLDQEHVLALTAMAYSEFFGQGNLSDATAKEALAVSNYLANETTASWKRLWYLYSLTDEEFINFSNDVYHRLVNLEYTSEGELLHVVSMMLSLSSNGLIAQTKKRMSVIVKNVVRDSIAKNKIDIGSNGSRSGRYSRDMSAYGLGFTGPESSDFKDFLAYYRKQQSIARMKLVRIQTNSWIKMLELDTELWAKQLKKHGTEDSWFSDDPVFTFVSADKFAKILLKVPTPIIEEIQSIFKERYGNLHNYTKWKIQELSFLEKVHSKVAIKIKSATPLSLSKHYLKTCFLPALNVLIDDLKSFEANK